MFTALHRPASFYRQLFGLAIPIMLQNLITTSLGFVDTFMVGLVGENALSAVTAANSPVFLSQMVAFGLMSGLGILVSQYWGKGDMVAINRTFGVAVYTTLTIAGSVAILFFCAPYFVMGIMTNNQLLIEIGAPYLRIVSVGLVFNALSSVYVSLQRSTENPLFGMCVFGCSMLINTFLNYCLIFGNFGAPELGVIGAAYATAFSRTIEFVIVVVYICVNRRIPLDFKLMLRPKLDAVKQFSRYCVPVLLNETLWGAGNGCMVMILGHMAISTDMLAAYAIIGNTDRIIVSLAIGMASAAAVMIGKSIGEGRPVQTVYDLGISLQVISCLGGVFMAILQLILLFTLFQGVVFPLFQLSVHATAIATVMSVAFALILPIRSFDFTSITGVLRAGGDTNMALIIDIVPQWLFAIPLTALCALVLDAPLFLICLGIQGEAFLKMPWGLLRIRSKKWIHNLTQEGASCAP